MMMYGGIPIRNEKVSIEIQESSENHGIIAVREATTVNVKITRYAGTWA